ncbi:unnamed protein product [Cyclocybe aegerita]|uniref:WSC domain-containing protein n=1 Tax=Cyclocybe aegerita TaxID=1973307 RepID=A0A8S0W2Z3_CYCAE|nr:unnamed protein product [Cyclocybe aegerita]
MKCSALDKYLDVCDAKPLKAIISTFMMACSGITASGLAFFALGVAFTLASPSLVASTLEERQIDGRPPEWEYRGCYRDSPSFRTLQGAYMSSDNMTRDMCKAFCDIEGYALGGTEFGRECFCDHTYRFEFSESEPCTMPCAGNPQETCGDINRLDIYRNINAFIPNVKNVVDGWSYKGCYLDPVNPRALSFTAHPEIGGGMSIEKCIATCKAHGYAIAGVEFRSECYCGNELADDVTHQVGEERCWLRCTGDPREYCGGAGALGVYSL